MSNEEMILEDCNCDAVTDELAAALSDIEEYVDRIVDLQSQLEEVQAIIADLRALVAEFYGEDRNEHVQPH